MIKTLVLKKEVNNVDAEPTECDSDPDDLDLTTLVLDDPNSFRCKNIGIYNTRTF